MAKKISFSQWRTASVYYETNVTLTREEILEFLEIEDSGQSIEELAELMKKNIGYASLNEYFDEVAMDEDCVDRGEIEYTVVGE